MIASFLDIFDSFIMQTHLLRQCNEKLYEFYLFIDCLYYSVIHNIVCETREQLLDFIIYVTDIDLFLLNFTIKKQFL